MSFSDLLEVVDTLSIEEQEDFAELVQKRLIVKKREVLLSEIKESTIDFYAGRLHPQTVDEIIQDLTK